MEALSDITISMIENGHNCTVHWQIILPSTGYVSAFHHHIIIIDHTSRRSLTKGIVKLARNQWHGMAGRKAGQSQCQQYSRNSVFIETLLHLHWAFVRSFLWILARSWTTPVCSSLAGGRSSLLLFRNMETLSFSLLHIDTNCCFTVRLQWILGGKTLSITVL